MQSGQVQRPDKSFIRLLLLAALLRLNKVLQANAFDFSPLPQLRVCLPTLTRSLQYTHTQSSDMEPGTRKIFTCVEEVNKCSLFTYWDQSHPPFSDLKACGGGGWVRWDEGRLSATWRRGTFRCFGMENAGGTVRSTRSPLISRGIAARLNEPLVRKRMRTPYIQSRYKKTHRCLCLFLYTPIG